MKNTVGSLIGIVLNLQIALGSIIIYTLLILPIQEYGTFLYLYVSSINAGEGVEKREPSYTVGGNANWYSHYGEQRGDSIKKKKKSGNRTAA